MRFAKIFFWRFAGDGVKPVNEMGLVVEVRLVGAFGEALCQIVLSVIYKMIELDDITKCFRIDPDELLE